MSYVTLAFSSSRSCVIFQVSREDWHVPLGQLKKGLMSGVRLDVFFPGFLTLKHIGNRAYLKRAGVRVFEQASRGENMILQVLEQGTPDTRDVADQLLGQEIWVSWPHMAEAKVTKVMDARTVFFFRQEPQGGGAGAIATRATEPNEFCDKAIKER